jgi:hypothetical protein
MSTTNTPQPAVETLQPLRTALPEILPLPRSLARSLFLVDTDERAKACRVRFQDPTYFQDPRNEGREPLLFLLVEPFATDLMVSLWMDTPDTTFPLAIGMAGNKEIHVTPCFERYPNRPSNAELIALFEPYLA